MRGVERNRDGDVSHRRQDVAIQIVTEKVGRVAEIEVDANHTGERRSNARAKVDDAGNISAGVGAQPRGKKGLGASRHRDHHHTDERYHDEMEFHAFHIYRSCQADWRKAMMSASSSRLSPNAALAFSPAARARFRSFRTRSSPGSTRSRT